MKTEKTKSVLIALDYDPTAQKVAETGFDIAKAMGAEVTLLHVIADSSYYSTMEYSQRSGSMGFDQKEASHLFDNGLENAMKQFLNKTKQHLGDATIQTLLKDGELPEAILAAAKNLHADVIVMGSHSRRWLEDILLGSVTEKVLRHSSIPLFIIPTKKHG